MPTYATRSDFEAYVEGWVTDDPAALDRLLERAERDIDGILATRGDRTAGLKIDAAAELAAGSLEEWQTDALSRATCAQAEYRLAMGEEFFTQAQHSRVRGPDFTTEGRLPTIAPKALRELADTGLLRSLHNVDLVSPYTAPGQAGVSLPDMLLP